MSLIGSLEDLNLGDILQIISLSQKSGVLNLRARSGEGKIVFVDGLVRSAQLKEGAEDLRGVLVGGSFMTDAEFDEAVEASKASGLAIEKVIAKSTSLGQERVDSLMREAVEAVVVAMFGWKVGEFSFDIQGEAETGELALTLPLGINAQYLAMEGLRVRDEAGRSDETAADAKQGGQDGVEVDGEELSAHEMFGVAPPDEELPAAQTGEAAEVVAVAALEHVEAAESAELAEAEMITAEPIAVATPIDGGADVPTLAEEVTVEEPVRGETVVDAASQPPQRALPPAVVIDLDLAALEWAKDSLEGVFPRVHIFQNSELGLNRIRQYLARAEIPIVMVSPELAVDRLGGISDIRDFVRRLKSQAAGIQVVWLGEADSLPVHGADGAVVRPPGAMFNDPRRAAELAGMGAEMASYLMERVRMSQSPATSGLSGEALSSDHLRRLKEATGLLSDASRRGEVLPLVIRFAGETFARVAMFMVREDSVLGMAQQGMQAAGGPDDSGIRDIALKADSCGWFRDVLGRCAPLRAAPIDEGDEALAGLLGDRVPGQAYLAPIESGGQIVALLYGDNLPADEPLGDTSALEVVLHHAGLAIDRAALERALAQMVDEAPGPETSGGD